jgi:hypothetical protein
VNPPTSQRCDCGFDFVARLVDPAVFKLPFPGRVNAAMLASLGVVTVVAIPRLNRFIAGPRTWTGVYWASVVTSLWVLYFLCRAGQNWARICFGILTLPMGLVVLLSKDARLYCQRRKEL